MEEQYDLDTLMEYLGDSGKYQYQQFFLHILAAVTAGLNMLSLVTVAAVPDHRCAIPRENVSDTLFTLNHSILERYIPKLDSNDFNNCYLINITTNVSYKCDAWVFDKVYYETSKVIEWNAVCDRKWMGAAAQSIYMFGTFTGAVVLGHMADKYGRKPIFCWSAVLQLTLGLALAFTPEYFTFFFLRYLYGIFGSAGSYIPGFVLTMELVGPSKRSMCGVAFQAGFAVGVMLVAGWGAILKDVKLLQILYSCHAIILIPHIWLMDESPRWLWSHNRKSESIAIIQKALKFNGNPLRVEIQALVSNRKSTVKKSYGILDLFKTPNLRKKTINICFCWFANSIVYYGLSLNTGRLKGNPYYVLFAISAIEIPSYFLCVYLMDKLGRRCLTSFYMISGGLCCIISTAVNNKNIISIIIVILGKFLISSSFAITYNYSAELFPTIIRNSAIGLGSMFARASGALTPLIILIDSFEPKLPSVIFAVVAIFSGCMILFLPETLNKPMPQTLEDGENFGIEDSCFKKCLGRSTSTVIENTDYEIQTFNSWK